MLVTLRFAQSSELSTSTIGGWLPGNRAHSVRAGFQTQVVEQL